MDTQTFTYLSSSSGATVDVPGALPILVSPSENGLVGWIPGERFHHLFEQRVKEFGWRLSRQRIAVENGSTRTSYQALDARANQIADYLCKLGVSSGDRIAMLVDRSADTYAAILAISKLHAVFVPLDATFPADRLEFIIQDAACTFVVTESQYAHLFSKTSASTVLLDGDAEKIKKCSTRPLKAIAAAKYPDDETCYIIYTSGTTGKPKGVPISHSAICSFLRVACEHYGYLESDRVYQGMSIAFDFSFEELWVPLVVGATLVPSPAGAKLLGQDLATFLDTQGITAICCVPTMLATMEHELPSLRFLMVSGEACPQDLAARWARPGRRFLNTYGPTEATVSATWAVVQAGANVTIGGPLPSYSIVILEPGSKRALPKGASGEICIAGIGVAEGYLNRPEVTNKVFLEDFIGIRNNRSGRIYRTGDLGRINEQNQIEYQGRIDTQIKIRGYRIELEEIEAVSRTIPWMDQVVVNPHQEDDGRIELVAYYTCHQEVSEAEFTAAHQELRRQLPPYMVPAYFERLSEIPLLASTKVDRKSLPAPQATRLLATGKTYTAPRTQSEQSLCELLEAMLKMDRISIDDDFFNELGASSLDLAQYLSKVRRTLGWKCSMKQLYQNPTIAQLALSLDPDTQSATDTFDDAAPCGRSNGSFARTDASAACMAQSHQGTPLPNRHERKPPRIATRRERTVCATLQLCFFALVTLATSLGSIWSYEWVMASHRFGEMYARAVLSSATLYVGASTLLIAIKWIVLGRFTTEPIAIWSIQYVRFWIAKTCVQYHPMNLFIGSPLYTVYLRLMGARIGKNSLVFSRPPTCTDLITIGDDSVIRQDCFFPGYTATGGYIYPGRIAIGSRSFVAEATVLDVNTRIGDSAQLGTSSALLEGQSIPDGAVYQGSPAGPCESNFQRVPTVPISSLRRYAYIAFQLLTQSLIILPLPLVGLFAMLRLGFSAAEMESVSVLAMVQHTIAFSLLFYFGGLACSLLGVISVPRLLNWFVIPDQVHPLFGFQYFLSRTINQISNSFVLNTIFGDSSMIVYYLSAIGYDLSESTQTGSNFGVVQRHHSPFLVKFHRNTLVSDGLTMINMETSTSSFQMKKVAVAADNYLGNLLHYPSNSKVGENCLIATRAMIPIDGPVRADVGILGSPPFEIPRSVMRDRRFDHFKEPKLLEQRLWMKLRSNLVTLAWYLFRNWSAQACLMMLSIATYTYVSAASLGTQSLVFTVLGCLSLFLIPVYMILFERIVLWMHPIRPLYCSLYDRDFWMHERFWKINYNVLLAAFNGTPFKGIFMRLQGADFGHNVFDDGASYTEPSLVKIGDNCCFNQHTALQCHSLEDGTFKSDMIKVGDNCTVEVRGFVHYGTRVHDGATVRADSFLMKGSVIERNSVWFGNPAREELIQEVYEELPDVVLRPPTEVPARSTILAAN